MRSVFLLALLGVAPAPVVPKVKPGQVTATKPDRTGVVTMLRRFAAEQAREAAHEYARAAA